MSFTSLNSATPKIKQTITREYNNGKSMRKIEKDYNISRSIIWNVLGKRGLLNAVPRKLTLEKTLELIAKYKNGSRLKELMWDYNLTMNAIYGILLKSNTPIKTSEERYKAVLKDYQSGMLKEQVIEKHRICLRTLRNILNRANCPWKELELNQLK